MVSGPLERLPVLPLRNSVLFPMCVVPINVGRPRSVQLVEALEGEDNLLAVVAQKNPRVVEPTFDDLYQVGTLARVVKVIRLGPRNYSVVLNGVARARIEEPLELEPYLSAQMRRIEEELPSPEASELAQSLRERTRVVLDLMSKSLGADAAKETPAILENVREPGALADLITYNFSEDFASIEKRQQVLEAFSLEKRLSLVLSLVNRQAELLQVKGEITALVQEEMSRSQRDYVLRQQIKSIREELGETDDDEVEALRERVALAEMPPDVEKAARKQLGRLAIMQPQGSEFNLTRTYVEWLADLPWSRSSVDRIDVKEVKRCLDEDHWGLETVKKRIIEYTAIRQLRADKRGPILLFVGPPGVGKTSLGRSIARAMGRRYGRIALGGVRDEAEIRGHRRTYVGALPGRIIQALKKVGTRNPVLVLDEVDKLGADMRGDPAAALLEVLDPAQNDTFVDHYLEVPFDLSQITFLATANYPRDIPEALRDRLEVIEVPGYPRTDKLNIAKHFLVPKQLSEHGLTSAQLEFTSEGLELLVDAYTREAGVRSLERQIASICRDIAVRLAEGEQVMAQQTTHAYIEKVLGVHKYRPEMAERQPSAGIATGLGLNSAGGELIFVEASKMRGKGQLHITGNLRDVMKESANTAMSLVRSKADRLMLPPDWFKEIDVHLHVARARAIQDAASLGVPVFVAIVSLLLNAPVRPEVGILGELTLRGMVLPIDGIKDIVLAAHRAGLRELVMPERNIRDLDEISPQILNDIKVHPVTRLDQVLGLVLLPAELQAAPEPNLSGAAAP